MVAISSEIVHLMKVKLSLQNNQRWLLLLPWCSKFSGGGPPNPPSGLENMGFIFQFNTAQHKPLVKKMSQYNNSRGNNNNKVNELYSLFLKFSAMGLLQDIRNNFHS